MDFHSQLLRGERGKKKRLKNEWSAANKFNTSYRDISVIVAENNSVVKPKYEQYTSLNKMLSNFSKVLMAHISFNAVINNEGIGKGIGGIKTVIKLFSATRRRVSSMGLRDQFGEWGRKGRIGEVWSLGTTFSQLTIKTHASQRYLKAAEDLRCSS